MNCAPKSRRKRVTTGLIAGDKRATTTAAMNKGQRHGISFQGTRQLLAPKSNPYPHSWRPQQSSETENMTAATQLILATARYEGGLSFSKRTGRPADSRQRGSGSLARKAGGCCSSGGAVALLHHHTTKLQAVSRWEKNYRRNLPSGYA